ncbi:nuclear envelope protein Cut8 [Myxozyma melibiosi]|uniref:Tethering factor for nuclear proteasome STS1 n=1 Tax=Myxozyma melibiosi TaxID=54550 RepID=A0ABR1EYI3_9ASCO
MSAVLPLAGPHVGFPFSTQLRESGPESPTQHQSRIGQKRKTHDYDSDDEMVSSPEGTSPSFTASAHDYAHQHASPISHHSHSRPHASLPKRARTEIIGRPLPLARQLETLDARALKAIICQLADKHVYLSDEISGMAPVPTVHSSLELLTRYFDRISGAFPYKCDPAGDYAYLRVRPQISEFLDAVSDYTPHFLPPREQQVGNCLQFLDGVTTLVHKLPDWTTEANNSLKHAAYDELSRAWALVVREALKRANGIVLEYGGWRDKIEKHNQAAGGRLERAAQTVEEGLSGHNQRRIVPGRFF